MAMCIINNSHKFIFIHVPKTAGTSLSNYYSKLSTCRDVEIGGTELGESLQKHYIKRYGLRKHSTLLDITNSLGREVVSGFLTFGFVRNPYQRLFSSFRFLKTWEDSKNHPELIGINNINDFVFSRFFDNSALDKILEPQSSWLTQASIGVEESVSFVGRVETLENSVREINELLGLGNRSVDLPRMNVTDPGESTKQLLAKLSRDALEKINSKYESDFVMYRYNPA